jgi:DNA-binding transcriptional MerR regulator
VRVKPYVLRYWEQEFTQLKPMKRRGNRRYYQHHEVLLIRRIRELLYDQGFTISGARNRLADALSGLRQASAAAWGR